jgi:dTDP-4-dehydrorhamnose 3,5-epimerase-like enzyme
MRIIAPYKKLGDKRGSFLGIVNSGQWEEMNYVETEAGQVRGGHYHKETRELFYIIDGEIEISIQDLNGNTLNNCIVSGGTILEIEPFEVHTFTCHTKSRWINVLSLKIDDRSCDIHLPSRKQEETTK